MPLRRAAAKGKPFRRLARFHYAWTRDLRRMGLGGMEKVYVARAGALNSLRKKVISEARRATSAAKAFLQTMRLSQRGSAAPPTIKDNADFFRSLRSDEERNAH